MRVRKIINLQKSIVLSAVLFQASAIAKVHAFTPTTITKINAATAKNGVTNIWTGAADTNWDNPANWSNATVPTQFDSVVIPQTTTNQPIITARTGYALTITVNANATLTVVTGATLQVVNAVKVVTGGNLVIEHNASLLQDYSLPNSGIITVQKNTNPLYRLDYTMWSSPVSGQQLQAFSKLTTPRRFYEYKYAYDPVRESNAEHYYEVDPATLFEAGKGYLIRMPNVDPAPGYMDGTTAIPYNGVFTGTPNNGDIAVKLSTFGSHYTAVGNPYPSPINLGQFFSQNSDVLEPGTALYFWRKKNDRNVSSYATLTLAGLVANNASKKGVGTDGYANGGQDQEVFFQGSYRSWTLSQGQGFIVQTKDRAGDPYLSFSNSLRTAAPATGKQAFLRQQQSGISRLWLNLTNTQDGFSQAAVAYIPEATTGLDLGFDGVQLAEDNTIALFTNVENKNLSIQARPAFNATDKVSLGYTANAAGSYSISLDHTDGVFDNEQDIFIKDNQLNVLHNIKDEAYTFTTDAGTFKERFTVVYNKTAAEELSTPEFNANSVVVFKQGTDINITTGEQQMASVIVYNIAGQKLFANNNVNANQLIINSVTAQQQVLLVEITADNGSIVSKKIIL